MISLDNLPGVAQVAIQGSRFAAKQIKRRLDGKEPEPAFQYFDKGSMATISRFSAVASIGKLRFSGFVAWLLWLALVIGLAIFTGHGLAQAPAPVTVDLTPRQLTPRVWYVEGDTGTVSLRNQGFMSNAGFVVTDDTGWVYVRGSAPLHVPDQTTYPSW